MNDRRERFEPVEIEDATTLRETEKALLVLVAGREHWIPKSQIDDDSEVFEHDEHDPTHGTLVIPRWLAEEKDLA